jgi:hypothetical protein
MEIGEVCGWIHSHLLHMNLSNVCGFMFGVGWRVYISKLVSTLWTGLKMSCQVVEVLLSIFSIITLRPRTCFPSSPTWRKPRQIAFVLIASYSQGADESGSVDLFQSTGQIINPTPQHMWDWTLARRPERRQLGQPLSILEDPIQQYNSFVPLEVYLQLRSEVYIHLGLESFKLVFQPLHNILVNKL